MDEIINGEADRAAMSSIGLKVRSASPGAKAVLSCSASSAVRIFDETDTAVIGPGTGGEYEIPSEEVFGEGVVYRIEGMEGGTELLLTLECRDEDDGHIASDSMKITTVGMGVENGFAIGSLKRVIVANQKDIGDRPTCNWYGNAEAMPARIVMRLKPDEEITQNLNLLLYRPLDEEGQEWFGWYKVCNQAGEAAWPLDYALTLDPDANDLWDIICAEYYAMYGSYPTAEQAWGYMYMFLGIDPADGPYCWEIPPTGTLGEQYLYILNRFTYAMVQYVRMTIIRIEFDMMWETKNRANQIFNPTRKDDPVNSSQMPDANGDTYGVPRNNIYLVPDPSDSKYKATIKADIVPASVRPNVRAAAYIGETKVSGSDMAFDTSGECAMEFAHMGSDIQDFDIRVGYDSDGDSYLNDDEIMSFQVTDTAGTDIGNPVVRGTKESFYTTSQSEIDFIITSPLTAIPLKHARQFLRIFRDGNFASVPTDLQPSSFAYDNSFNCFSGLFSEWLSHNSGAEFNDSGTAGIWHYAWDETKSVAQLVGDNFPVVQPMVNFYWSTVYPQVVTDFAGQPVGFTKTYPSPSTSYDIPHTHESPAWVPSTTKKFATFPEFLSLVDDLNGTIGRGRLTSHKAQFTVEKKDIGYIVLDVTEVRSVGEVQDLYDFNHEAGGPAQNAAVLQIGYGNGSYGTSRTQGRIWRNTIKFDITYDHLP